MMTALLLLPLLLPCALPALARRALDRLAPGTALWDEWSDGWTIVTRDRSLTAQFEHTLVVTERGAEILTLP